MITKDELLTKLRQIRILETSFPAYTPDGVVRKRKTHLLLTYTPKEIAVPEEEYALNTDQMQDLFDSIYAYVLNSTMKNPPERKKAKTPVCDMCGKGIASGHLIVCRDHKINEGRTAGHPLKNKIKLCMDCWEDLNKATNSRREVK